MSIAVHTDPLRPIPLLDVGPEFALATLDLATDRLTALLDAATAHAPTAALKVGDAVSRRWLVKSRNRYLAEIDAVAQRLRRPGAYFFAINYEWGCTVGVAACPHRKTARLVRVLDWRTPGLGRNIVAARVAAPAGPFVTLTWPGYTGVLQAMAPGRFSAALNQAPMLRRGGGLYALDWAANKARVWRLDHTTPAHLLREVMETAADFREARRRLTETPIAAPAIFSLAGIRPSETVIIERLERAAHVHEGLHCAANHWQSPGWRGRARGNESAARARQMATIPADLDPAFPWLQQPILNERTRLVMVASAAEGRLVAQGFEAGLPATLPLELAPAPVAEAIRQPARGPVLAPVGETATTA
jgi:hypothetical protein